MSAHTPTLRWYPDHLGSALVVVGPDDVIAQCVDPEYAPALVTRFNAHDALVAALREMVDCYAPTSLTTERHDGWPGAVVHARAALAAVDAPPAHPIAEGVHER